MPARGSGLVTGPIDGQLFQIAHDLIAAHHGDVSFEKNIGEYQTNFEGIAHVRCKKATVMEISYICFSEIQNTWNISWAWNSIGCNIFKRRCGSKGSAKQNIMTEFFL